MINMLQFVLSATDVEVYNPVSLALSHSPGKDHVNKHIYPYPELLSMEITLVGPFHQNQEDPQNYIYWRQAYVRIR